MKTPELLDLAKILERAAFEVDRASDGEEALQMLGENEEYGAVVLDLTMPRKSGFDVINALKLHRPESLKGLVVVSAVARQLRRSDRDVVCAVVRKPFDLATITSAVEACLRCENGDG